MKSFSSHLIELFDKPHKWNLWHSGGNEMIYNFGFAKVRGGKSVPSPLAGEPLKDFYKSQGLEITGGDGETPLVNGKPTHLTGAIYEVGFHTLEMYSSKYKPLIDNSNLKESDLKNIWELYFTRADAILTQSTRPRPSVRPSSGGLFWYFKSHGKSDDDLGVMSGADAAMILGTVLDIGKAFVAAKKPKGILIGTKEEAKDARGRIYRGIARQNAGEVFDLPYQARTGMKHSSLIWFDKSMKFDPDANRSR
jgi:hypothetical protein